MEAHSAYMGVSSKSVQLKQTLTKIDLLNQLNNQVEKLKIFCKIYDEGNEAIAEDIAVKLRVILHNTNKSKSLARQLKIEHLDFVDTSKKYDSKNLVSHWGLILIKSQVITNRNVVSKWIPLFEVRNESALVKLENWWDGKKIIVDDDKAVFTRKKIILEVADTDGGAHVDESIKSDYYKLTRMNSLGFYHGGVDNVEKPMNNPIPSTIRQIAHELILTLNRYDIKTVSKLK